MFLNTCEDNESCRIHPDACRNALWSLSELLKSSSPSNEDIFRRIVVVVGNLMILREMKEEWCFELSDLSVIIASQLVLFSKEKFIQYFNEVGTKNSHPLQALQSWCKILFRMSDEEISRPMAVEGWSIFVSERMDLVFQFTPLVLADLASFDFRIADPKVHMMLVDVVRKIRNGFGSNEAEWKRNVQLLSPALRQRLVEVYGS